MMLRGRLRIRKKRLDELERLTLKPFGEMYFKFEETLREALKTKTDSELLRIRDAIKKINKKDWYAIYRIKESLKETVNEISKKRA